MRDIIIETPATNRILVAEDDAVIMRLVTAILEGDDYVVVPAFDGREAYKILQSDANFVGAIFDMHMPHLKGLDIINYMQTERRLKRIPVMMMTGERDYALCSTFILAGAALFLHKPFSPTQMQMMLHLLVSRGAGHINKKPNPLRVLAA
jgi:CheY-like chemotaxis protein